LEKDVAVKRKLVAPCCLLDAAESVFAIPWRTKMRVYLEAGFLQRPENFLS
jgi:hypothetical protein